VTRCTLGPKKDFQAAVKRDVEPRVQEGLKAVLEEVLEERTEHLDQTPSYPCGQDRAPRDSEGPRGRVCHRSLRALRAHETGDVEEATS
jgi:hypothetical protein